MNVRFLVLAMAAALVNGCAPISRLPSAFQCLGNSAYCGETHSSSGDPNLQLSPVNITAIGYGAESNYAGYTDGQRRILAIRAAKVDALRALAEEAYGVRVMGQTTVHSAMVQNDSARLYVNAFVRGARFTQITPVAQGNYEVTAELTLDQGFFECIRFPARHGCNFQQLATTPPVLPGYVQAGSAVAF
ncbi:conserved exported hypothetical protein [Gammaproteobacteria bacterium]